jgi:hypothetical protein
MRRESQLEAELEQAEEVYEGLIQTRGSLGTMLAETIRKGKDLEEFKRHLRDLPLLIQQADLRRTELRHELLDRRAKQAEDEYRRAAEEAQRAARSHEQARKAHLKGQRAARRSGLEARRLAGARDKEAEHLQELLRVMDDAQRHQGDHQREEQDEERAHSPSQAHHGDVRATLGASIARGEDANRRSAE